MPPPPAAARPQETLTTRELILEAAERRFAERGFAGVSMRDLASDAGLRNQASLYNHFRNKRALYEEVLTSGIGPIVAVIAASGASRTTGARSGRTDAFLDLLLDYLAEHPHLPRLIQRAALEDGHHVRKVLTRLMRPLYAQGIEVLAAAGRSWQPAELPHLAAGLYQIIFGYFANAKLLQTVTDGDPLGPSAMARQRRFLKAAVTRLLGPWRDGPRGVPADKRKGRRPPTPPRSTRARSDDTRRGT